MKKRIFSVLLLSMLLIAAMVSSAAAGTTYYYGLGTLSTGNTTPTSLEGIDSGTSISVPLSVATSRATSAGSNPTKITDTTITWTITAGNDLGSFSLENIETTVPNQSSTSTNTLSGTVTKSGTITVQAQLGNSTNHLKTVNIAITVNTVVVEDAPKPTFKTTSITGLKAGTDLGDGKVIELTQSEEKLGTVTWAIADDEVTKLATYGLEFSTDTHALTGTPTQSGTFSFTVTASNYKGETLQETAQAISVTISGTKPSFLNWMPADKANMGKTTSATKEMIGPFFRNGVLVKDRAIAPFAEETTDGTDETNESLPRRNGDGDGEETEPTESDTQQFILGVQGTLPITVTVTGLPTGLTATQADEAGKTVLDIGGEQTVAPNGETATYDGTNGTAWVVITGTPTKAAVNKSVKITAKNADGEISRTYTMEVLARPTLKTTSVKATWGKALKTTLKADGGTKDHVITWSVASGDLPDGIELNEKTGELTGTYQWNDGGDVFGATDKTHTFSVWIMPENDAGTAEDEPTSKTKVDIVMSLAKPVITNKKAKVTYGGETAIALSSIPTMKLEDRAITPIYLVVSGGGALTWTSGDLPAGLQVAMAEGFDPSAVTGGDSSGGDSTNTGSLPRRNGDDGDGSTTTDENPQEVDSSIVIYGTPTDTAKNQSVKFQVANAAGNDSVTLKFNITGTEVTFNSILPHKTTDYTTSPSAGDAVGREYTDSNMIELVATPGPITWSAKNLPAGIKLSDDKSDTTRAYLVGTLTKATKFDKNGRNVVTVTATNKNITDKTKGSVTISSDWRVFEAPVITTTKLSDLTTSKKYTGKVAVKNAGADNIFVYIHEDATPTADQLSTPLTWEDEFNLSEKSNYSLKWSSDIMAIVGSLDRMPDDGQFYVSIWAENAAGTAETVTLPIKVKGQAPKLTTSKLKAFTSGSASDATTAQDKTTQGTQPITLRAYIDNKTAKAFGWVTEDSTESIDITNTEATLADTNPTG
ncbi:MAG: putative Ig domain-containing protein, partial [Synergistaceae bacterium]|nr:putative Ig domain-containing protein [Synergistaceae bacterium]